MFVDAIERMRDMFVFIHLTNRTKFLFHVYSSIKQTDINELPAEWFTNCSLKVMFIYSPRCNTSIAPISDKSEFRTTNPDN
ncbi:hypothetical protein Hanom_Chr05g00455671 [Helianthus anomalus]